MRYGHIFFILVFLAAISVGANCAQENLQEGELPQVDLDGFESWTKNPTLDKEQGLWWVRTFCWTIGASCPDDLLLSWSPVSEDTGGNPMAVDHYQVYRDTLAFREPGSDPFQTTADTFLVDDTGVVGDIGRHYFYWITAVSGTKESADSQGAGELDRYLYFGK